MSAIAAEIKEVEDSLRHLTFIIYNNGIGNYKFDLELTYGRKKLCMLHTSQPHKNKNGETIPAPHLHLYDEELSYKNAINFPCLRDCNNINQSVNDFLTYCHVENIGDLPLQFELGMK